MRNNNVTRIIAFVLFMSLAIGKIWCQETIPLDKNWTFQPYGEWSSDGKLIKPGDYDPANKFTCDVPSTVFAALVKNGKFSNPYFSDNLAKVPTQWFDVPWRYTKVFNIPSKLAGQFSRICFEGINYSADIFLNGVKIASADTLKGAFRRFEIDVTGKLKAEKNELAVCVFPPKPGDFTIGFVDWTPRPPDKNMGLWRGVNLRFNGQVSVENPFIRTKINPDNLSNASLTIESSVTNHSKTEVKTTLKAVIGNFTVSQEVKLKPLETKQVILSPEQHPALHLKDAKLWWPVGLGDPNLYTLLLSCEINNKVSDQVSKKFGIREVSSYINAQGSRIFKVNGRDYQIRGGGWTDDLLLREDARNVEAQVAYTKLMNLNTIRLEGFWGSSEKLYDTCDKYGILLMIGWSCQWEWEEYVGKKCDDFGGVQTPEEIDLVTRSLTDHIHWLRNHPSVFVWVLGSDKLPRPELEKRYLLDIAVADPTRPLLMSCKMLKSEITGSTGVKMNGPYDYVSPNYWYLDTVNGGGFGFNTETGPGPQIPPIESLRKMFPEDKLWPINEIWNFHSGRNQFNTVNNYVNALNNRYGKAGTLEDFMKKAGLANYEAIRPMFEAFAINKAEAGGIIQWMLNASWPKLYWQLYDYYLTPTTAFFGTQQALKPLNIIYNYGDKAIYVSNDLPGASQNLTAQIRILDLESKEIFNKSIPFSIDAYKSVKLTSLSELKNLPAVYFTDLRIYSADRKEIANNFYWLSSKEDVPDFRNTEWFITPMKEYADFSALNNLPAATVNKETSFEKQGEQTIIKVHLHNTSDKLAFFLEMKLKGATSGEMILPAFWSDNCVSLLPGEKRTLTVKVSTADLKNEQPRIEVKGYNTKI